MRRADLEHVLRAASTIAEDTDVLVIGSQSILAAIDEDRLPLEATASMEADVACFDDPGDERANKVEGAIGELSLFHQTNGYYAQGVSLTTATLPQGWRDRLVIVERVKVEIRAGELNYPYGEMCARAWENQPFSDR